MPYKDPEVRRSRQLARYHANRAAGLVQQAKQRARNNSIRDAAKMKPCADCGGTFPPVCMDFDHVRGEKHHCVSRMNTGSVEALLAEIAKCEVVCANCHRLRTQARRNHGTPDRRVALESW